MQLMLERINNSSVPSLVVLVNVQNTNSTKFKRVMFKVNVAIFKRRGKDLGGANINQDLLDHYFIMRSIT